MANENPKPHAPAVPPYEGRRESASEDAEEMQRKTGGDARSSGTSSTDQTSAPADEQPAADQEHTRDSDPGVDLGHSAGTPRAEDLDPDAESGREDTGTQGATGRPTGESTGRDATSVDPQDDDK